MNIAYIAEYIRRFGAARSIMSMSYETFLMQSKYAFNGVSKNLIFSLHINRISMLDETCYGSCDEMGNCWCYLTVWALSRGFEGVVPMVFKKIEIQIKI